MPPLPGKELREGILGGLDYITGFFKPPEHPEGRDNKSHATATGRSEDMDDVVEQSGASVRKRSREAHEEQSQSAKKQRKYSQEEERLVGRYNGPTPKDACRVMVPTNEQLDDIAVQSERATKVMRAPKPLGGVHRTKNTLSNSQPGRNGAPASVHKPTSNPGKPVTRAAPREMVYGDGFNDQASTRATPSKRRATNGAVKASTGKKTIDITGDSDEVTVGEVEAVNGNRVSSDSQNSVIEVGSSHSPPKPGYFGAQEMRNVHHNTNPPPVKKRRQHSSAQGSAYNGSHSQLRPSSRNTNHSVEVDDLNTPASRFTVNKARVAKGESDTKPGLPKIDLGKGTEVDDIKAARDVKLVNGAIGSRMYSHARGLPEEPDVQDPMSVSTSVRRHIGARPGWRTLAEEIAHEESRGEQRLGAKFRRVSNSPPAATRQQQQQQKHQHRLHQNQQQQQPPPRQSRAKAMLVSSGNGGSKSFEDSPDQLHATPPNISRKPADGRSSVSVTRESPRQHSPSDIKTTKFTSKATKSISMSQPARKAKKSPDPTDDAPVRIPLTQIHSRGCPITSTESHPVELVWREGDAGEAHFEVERNGSPAGVLGRDEIMSIGMHESSTLHYNQESTKVALYGSSSAGRSNGCILLQFPDVASREDFADYLAVASKDTMKTKHEDAGRMDRLFETQAKVVEADAGKYALTVLADVKIKQDARHKEHHPSSGERIAYEQPDGGSSNHVFVRPRLLGNDTASPYFSGHDHQPRKSTRQSKVAIERSPSPDPVAERWTQTHPQTPWHQSVMYPATGARRITVDFQDLERLDEGEFLNDNIVGYALRRIEENMAPEHKSKVHFFNSYFFTSLTSKNGRKTFNYESVKKWTKQKDLFDIPYVVVPINENFHWYVAIICNLPSLRRKSAALDDRSSDAAATPSTSQQASARPSPIKDPVVPDSQGHNENPDAQAMESLSIESERPSRAGSEVIEFDEDGKVASNNHDAHTDLPAQVKGGKKSKKRTAPALPRYPTDKPIIITLDSFGQAHTGQVASLKDYVAAEAMEKRGMEVGREDMKGMTATGVPLQQNFCDCGLYLVGYVAEFAKDPEGFVNKVLTRQLDGESDFAAFDPSKKRDEIRDDLIRLHNEQDAERVALKKAKRNRVPLTAVADASTLVASPGTRSTPGRAAQSLSTVEQSAHAPSTTPIKAPGKLRASKASTPDLHARGKIQYAGGAPSNDAGDNEEMEFGMPLALPSVRSPKKANKSAMTHTQFEDGEMLDNRHDEDAIECRPKGMRKVVSPELEGLSTILNAGPLAAPLHAREKSPGSEKPSP